MINQKLVNEIESFKWESKAQKEGYLAYCHYCRTVGKDSPTSIDPFITFSIQKDIDAQAYMNDVWSNQITSLENQMKIMMDSMIELRADYNAISSLVLSHQEEKSIQP